MIHTVTTTTKFKLFVRALRPLVPYPPVAIETVAVGILERLWHSTAINTPLGDIGRLPNDVIAEEVGWTLDADALVNLLIENRWLDVHPVHRLVTHDWADHAPKWVKGIAARSGGFIAKDVADPKSATNVTNDTTLSGQPKVAQPKVGDPGPPTPNLTKPNLTTPLPPEPDPDGEPTWGEVVEVFSENGISTAGAVVRTMKSQRSTPARALQIVVHYHQIRTQQPDRYAKWKNPGGVLYRRLTEDSPNIRIEDGWPGIAQAPLPALRRRKDPVVQRNIAIANAVADARKAGWEQERIDELIERMEREPVGV
jgi:hypothetical protein